MEQICWQLDRGEKRPQSLYPFCFYTIGTTNLTLELNVFSIFSLWHHQLCHRGNCIPSPHHVGIRCYFNVNYESGLSTNIYLSTILSGIVLVWIVNLLVKEIVQLPSFCTGLITLSLSSITSSCLMTSVWHHEFVSKHYHSTHSPHSLHSHSLH